MNALKNFVARLVKDEQGQDLIEYALLATFVSLVAIVGATALGSALNIWYGTVATNVSGASGYGQLGTKKTRTVRVGRTLGGPSDPFRAGSAFPS